MLCVFAGFQAHFKRWVQHSEWPQELQDWVLQLMAMPLPPFHAHMHTAACQAKNTLSRVPAGGTGIGEPTEQMNRFLGLAGVVLQYATLSARALWLEVLFRRWNVHKARDLPRLLVSSGYRAAARKAQLTEKQTDLAKQALNAAAVLRLPCGAEFVTQVRLWGAWWAPHRPSMLGS
jgi:hypothetical protein